MVVERVLDVMGKPMRLTLEGSEVADLGAAIDRAWERSLLPADASSSSGAAPADESEPVTVRVVLDADDAVVTQARSEGAVAGTTELVVMDELTTRLVHEGLEQLVGDRWLLHACALADPVTGACVVLVAPSGTGKTTASRTLARTLGYVTDETAVVERDGSMVPFPKPLSLLVDGTRPKRQVAPGDLEMLPSPPAPWLARVALLARDPEATEVRIEEVPTVEALAFLAEQTSSLHLLERPLETVASILHARGGLARLVYAESADLAPLVAGWLSEATPMAPVTASPAPVATDVELPVLESGRVRRVAVRDEYHEDGEMSVLVEGRVLALSAMATLVLGAVNAAGPDGMPVTDLEAFLAAEVGAPAELSISEALAPILDDLVTNALLERGDQLLPEKVTGG